MCIINYLRVLGCRVVYRVGLWYYKKYDFSFYIDWYYNGGVELGKYKLLEVIWWFCILMVIVMVLRDRFRK